MNLQKLFEMQAGLDQHIIESKGLQGKDFLDEKILALQVELGELANELPEEFKFWANKKNNYENALKEYVDALHFILSIGNEICDVENSIKRINEATNWILECRNVKSTSITTQFNFVFGSISYFENMGENEHYYDIASEFFILGEKLGFTDEQVEQAYLEKNKTNHERQLNGY